MRYQLAFVVGLIAALAPAPAAGQALPVRNGRPAVASVNGKPIHVDQLLRELPPPAGATRLRKGLATAEELAVLDRLINIRLIAQEAATMGLADLSEIQKQVDVSSRDILRELLFEKIAASARPDPAVVEKLFRESVKEWKTTALLFQDEAAARRAHMEISNGAPFAEVAARAVASKAAKADGDDSFHSRKDYLPQIAEAIAPLQAGQLAPLVRLPAGFVVVKVLDIRYPENPEARAEARRKALAEKRAAAVSGREQELMRQYAVINQAVLKSIDYAAAKPGIDVLRKDTRVVAEIKGGTPVTVGDLTDYVRLQFFHGTTEAAQHKEMNAKKAEALNATLTRRVLNLEARRLGIDKTAEYRDQVAAFRDSLVFGTFVDKVITPENKMREEEVRAYYDGHQKEYSSPGMLRIRSLAFSRRAAAEDAIRKLKEGADYGWVVANASGQAGGGAPGLMVFDGRPVTIDSMPAGVQKAVAGSKAGEFRLYASPDGLFYVLAVQQVIAPSAKPYGEVRDEIAKKLFAEKLKKGVEEYARKLRAQSKVETYLKRVQ